MAVWVGRLWHLGDFLANPSASGEDHVLGLRLHDVDVTEQRYVASQRALLNSVRTKLRKSENDLWRAAL